MKFRYLLSCALFGGLVLFAWGAVSHMFLVMPSAEAKSFADSTTVVETVQKHAPENGVYFDGRGLLAVVSFRPDRGQKFESLAAPMLRQLAIEVAVALLLGWVLLRLPVWSAPGTASLFAAVGLAAGISQLLPQANWYGFPIPFLVFELADLVVGWFLLGLVLGWLRRRMMLGAER